MKLLYIVLVVFYILSQISTYEFEDTESRNYLGVFTVVKFANDACQGSHTTRFGQCLAYANCYMQGGYGDGSCAEGFGVCCLFFTTSCGSTVAENITYLQNPGYPTGYSTSTAVSCQYEVRKCESSVCMIRIDFEVLTLQDPQRTSVPATNSAGKCVVDQLAFSTSSGDKFGPLCGTETSNSQHLYLDLGYDSTDSATIVFSTNTAAPTSTNSRYWSLLITQIPCTGINRAQPDPSCRQWLTGITGTVQSFNFANTNSPQWLEGSYSICVRREAGYCQVCYQASTDANSFQTDSTTPAGTSGTSSCASTIARVFIPDSNVGGQRNEVTRDVYCGGALLPAYLCSITSNKLTVSFVSPPAPVALGGTGDTMKGFKLLYRQMPCSS